MIILISTKIRNENNKFYYTTCWHVAIYYTYNSDRNKSCHWHNITIGCRYRCLLNWIKENPFACRTVIVLLTIVMNTYYCIKYIIDVYILYTLYRMQLLEYLVEKIMGVTHFFNATYPYPLFRNQIFWSSCIYIYSHYYKWYCWIDDIISDEIAWQMNHQGKSCIINIRHTQLAHRSLL